MGEKRVLAKKILFRCVVPAEISAALCFRFLITKLLSFFGEGLSVFPLSTRNFSIIEFISIFNLSKITSIELFFCIEIDKRMDVRLEVVDVLRHVLDTVVLIVVFAIGNSLDQSGARGGGGKDHFEELAGYEVVVILEGSVVALIQKRVEGVASVTGVVESDQTSQQFQHELETSTKNKFEHLIIGLPFQPE